MGKNEKSGQSAPRAGFQQAAGSSQRVGNQIPAGTGSSSDSKPISTPASKPVGTSTRNTSPDTVINVGKGKKNEKPKPAGTGEGEERAGRRPAAKVDKGKAKATETAREGSPAGSRNSSSRSKNRGSARHIASPAGSDASSAYTSVWAATDHALDEDELSGTWKKVVEQRKLRPKTSEAEKDPIKPHGITEWIIEDFEEASRLEMEKGAAKKQREHFYDKGVLDHKKFETLHYADSSKRERAYALAHQSMCRSCFWDGAYANAEAELALFYLEHFHRRLKEADAAFAANKTRENGEAVKKIEVSAEKAREETRKAHHEAYERMRDVIAVENAHRIADDENLFGEGRMKRELARYERIRERSHELFEALKARKPVVVPKK